MCVLLTLKLYTVRMHHAVSGVIDIVFSIREATDKCITAG